MKKIIQFLVLVLFSFSCEKPSSASLSFSALDTEVKMEPEDSLFSKNLVIYFNKINFLVDSIHEKRTFAFSSSEIYNNLENCLFNRKGVRRKLKLINKIDSYSDFLLHFVLGHEIIRNDNTEQKAVELDQFAFDIEKSRNYSIMEKGTNNYLVCPFRFCENEIGLNTFEGKMKACISDKASEPVILNGKFMYAISVNGIVYFAKDTGDSNYPHPTLIGGENPNVKCSGIVIFLDGKILEINNSSGHFKVPEPLLKKALVVFESQFPKSFFHSEFRWNSKY